jgi:3',5'-cyclic AMP phosphodiesterase CpdA
VRIAVLGDSGTGSPEQHALAARILADAPDAVLHTGDVAYDSGTPDEVRCRYFVPYADLLPTAPVYLALGNHDQVLDEGAALLSSVRLPTNPVDGTERFYSVDAGPCHVLVLDTDRSVDPGTPEGDWIDADLAASGARWKLVVLHPPIWSSGRHGSDSALRAALAPVFEARGVDVVLCGHDHHYERTYPMTGDAPGDVASEPEYADPAGVVYVVTGGGGADLYETGTNPFTAHAESTFHFVRIDAGPTTLSLAAVRADGTVFDQATITKP